MRLLAWLVGCWSVSWARTSGGSSPRWPPLCWCTSLAGGGRPTVSASEREAEHAAIAARADQQQAWVLAGDDRGMCGADLGARSARLLPPTSARRSDLGLDQHAYRAERGCDVVIALRTVDGVKEQRQP